MTTYSNYKCLVLLCPNHSDGGEFLGPVCTACAHALSGGRSPASQERIIVSVLHYFLPNLTTKENN